MLNTTFTETSGIASEYWKGVLNLEGWKERPLTSENPENRNVEWQSKIDFNGEGYENHSFIVNLKVCYRKSGPISNAKRKKERIKLKTFFYTKCRVLFTWDKPHNMLIWLTLAIPWRTNFKRTTTLWDFFKIKPMLGQVTCELYLHPRSKNNRFEFEILWFALDSSISIVFL